MDYYELANKAEKNELKPIFEAIDRHAFENSKAVLDAFHKYEVSESCFNSTTGYGYGDVGRDIIEKIFADVLRAEKAVVRSQFISGSHRHQDHNKIKEKRK